MVNPWDPVYFPLQGDVEEKETLAGVGAVLTNWEGIELQLASIYSIFSVGKIHGRPFQQYGRPHIFRERLSKLRNLAERYFVDAPNQNTEGEFHRITVCAEGFADRRNEVAHGIVMNGANVHVLREKLALAPPNVKQYVLVPAQYSLRHHDKLRIPVFGYNSFQLWHLAHRMLEVERDANRFVNLISQK
jgi:hypothetical protein